MLNQTFQKWMVPHPQGGSDKIQGISEEKGLFGFLCFNGISNFVVYLMPKQS